MKQTKKNSTYKESWLLKHVRNSTIGYHLCLLISTALLFLTIQQINFKVILSITSKCEQSKVLMQFQKLTCTAKEYKYQNCNNFQSGTDSITTPVYLSFCLYSVCVVSVFRIVNETSTEANRLLISCTVQTAGQVHYKCTVYRGWNKQPYNCSKQSVCSPVPRMCMRVPDSCSICRACFLFLKIDNIRNQHKCNICQIRS